MMLIGLGLFSVAATGRSAGAAILVSALSDPSKRGKRREKRGKEEGGELFVYRPSFAKEQCERGKRKVKARSAILAFCDKRR